MANSLQQVIAYSVDQSLPVLDASLTLCGLANKRFDNWEGGVSGLRGDVATYRLPSRFSVADTLSWDASSGTTDGEFSERRGAIKLDKVSRVMHTITDEELQAYPLEDLQGDILDEKMSEIAAKMDADAAIGLASGGYRWAGSLAVPDAQNSTIVELVKAVKKYRNFGGAGKRLNMVLPDVGVARIANNGLTQFVPERNDMWATDWALGTLPGAVNTRFYESSHLPIHVSGTLADSFASGATIASVTSSTYTTPEGTTEACSTIELSGLTASTTTVKGDVDSKGGGDIGEVTGIASSVALKSLQFVGHQLSASNVQIRVVEGGVADGSGALSIKVVPELIYDATGANPARNLNRAIVPGTDKFYLVKSHIRGCLFMDKTFFMANPKLNNKSPFPSSTKTSPKGELALRSYYGSPLNVDITSWVFDAKYGFSMPHDYNMIIPFPVDVADL